MNRRGFLKSVGAFLGVGAAVSLPFFNHEKNNNEQRPINEKRQKKLKPRIKEIKPTSEKQIKIEEEIQYKEPRGLEIEIGRAISNLDDDGKELLMKKIAPHISRGPLLARLQEEGVVSQKFFTEHDISAVIAYEFDRMREAIKNETLRRRFGSTEQGRKKYFKELIAHKDEIIHAVTRASNEYNVPKWVIYGIIGVESGGNPKADSGVAKGIMQFTKNTAESFGLIDNGVDHRGNISLSIIAGAKYLARLYEIYGQWGLAMAAYTSGLSGFKHLMTEALGRIPSKEKLLSHGVSIVTISSPLFGKKGGSQTCKYPFIADCMSEWVQEELS